MKCNKCNACLTNEDKYCLKCGNKVKANKTLWYKILIGLFCIVSIVITVLLVKAKYYESDVVENKVTVEEIKLPSQQAIDKINQQLNTETPTIIPEAIQATWENSITIPQEVDISRNGNKALNIGYYNKNQFIAYGATLIIYHCSNPKNKVDSKLLPDITSEIKDVAVDENTNYKITIVEKGLQLGSYICTMRVVCNQDSVPIGVVCPSEAYDYRQFFLRI